MRVCCKAGTCNLLSGNELTLLIQSSQLSNTRQNVKSVLTIYSIRPRFVDIIRLVKILDSKKIQPIKMLYSRFGQIRKKDFSRKREMVNLKWSQWKFPGHLDLLPSRCIFPTNHCGRLEMWIASNVISSQATDQTVIG